MKEDLFSSYCNITAIFGGNKQKEMGGERERDTERERGGRGREGERRATTVCKRGDEEGLARKKTGADSSSQRPNVSTRYLGEKNKGVVWWGVWSGFFL